AGQLGALVQRYAQLLVGVQQLLWYLVQRLVLRALGRGVVAQRLQVDRADLQLGPVRLLHGQEVAIGIQAPLRHPFRLFLLGGKRADDILVQARSERFGFDIGDEAGVVLAAQLFVDFAVWSIGGADGFNGFGGHVGCLRLIQETTATSMRRRSVSGKGRSICARVTPRSASAST